MPRLTIPGTNCHLDYQILPDDEFVLGFTAAKQIHWGRTRNTIDDYIRCQIVEHIEKVRGLRAAVIEVIAGQQFQDRLAQRINNEFNRGLAIISNTPDVKITQKSPYEIVDSEVFEESMKKLLKHYMDLDKDARRTRIIRSREWADAAAFGIMEAFSKTLVRR